MSRHRHGGHFCSDSVPLRALHSILQKIIVVGRPITERIKELRQEIAELTEKNRRYSLGPKYGSAAADNERRFQRLIEIVEELKGLTDFFYPRKLRFYCV
jgi:hypothetical protein